MDVDQNFTREPNHWSAAILAAEVDGRSTIMGKRTAPVFCVAQNRILKDASAAKMAALQIQSGGVAALNAQNRILKDASAAKMAALQIQSGGVASLNHQLMAATLPGSG